MTQVDNLLPTLKTFESVDKIRLSGVQRKQIVARIATVFCFSELVYICTYVSLDDCYVLEWCDKLEPLNLIMIKVVFK